MFSFLLEDKVQKLFRYFGNFDDKGNWNDNIEEINRELKDSWINMRTVFEKALKFNPPKDAIDNIYYHPDTFVSVILFQKALLILMIQLWNRYQL